MERYATLVKRDALRWDVEVRTSGLTNGMSIVLFELWYQMERVLDGRNEYLGWELHGGPLLEMMRFSNAGGDEDAQAKIGALAHTWKLMKTERWALVMNEEDAREEGQRE